MVSNTVTFWSYLTFLIPSILCSIFALYHLLFDRNLRQALHNHVIIIVLIIGLIYEVTDYPWLLYYYRSDGKWERSFTFCQIWQFIDWGLYETQTIVFAWATIERHILIFHDKWVATRKKRFFVHYLPLILLLLYCFVLFGVVYFFPPCQNEISDYYPSCFAPCLYNDFKFSMFDTIVNSMTPIFIVVIFSVALLLRVISQKYRMRQPIQWRKQRKMAVQLLSISFLYLLFLFPYTFTNLMYLCGFQSAAMDGFREFATFSGYFMTLLYPFFCVLSLPELRTKLWNFLHLHRQPRRVGPMTLTLRNPGKTRMDAQ